MLSLVLLLLLYIYIIFVADEMCGMQFRDMQLTNAADFDGVHWLPQT